MAEPNQAKTTADNTVDTINRELQELGREVYKQADAARKETVKRLYDVADEIRARGKNAEGEARDTTDRIARNLEQTANYLNSRAVDQAEDVVETMRDNFWQTLMGVFIVGLVLGLFLSRRD
jgi:ElaB/YqjD/DUF883 family membrane-anchored ribosome-binding protein